MTLLTDPDRPMLKTFGITLGRFYIADILQPQPCEIDLDALERNLHNSQRFSQDPRALTDRQHTRMVVAVYRRAMAVVGQDPDEDVLWWCEHHDDHEGALGDTPGPYKNLIRCHTDIMDRVEEGFDRAICAAHGRAYPGWIVQKIVHGYDKIAETIEHKFLLNDESVAVWYRDYSMILTEDEARRLAWECRTNAPTLTLERSTA